MNETALFWHTCCTRGISLCEVPKPTPEHKTLYMLDKSNTCADRNTWYSAHLYPTCHEAVASIKEYFETGKEPCDTCEHDHTF